MLLKYSSILSFNCSKSECNLTVTGVVPTVRIFWTAFLRTRVILDLVTRILTAHASLAASSTCIPPVVPDGGAGAGVVPVVPFRTAPVEALALAVVVALALTLDLVVPGIGTAGAGLATGRAVGVEVAPGAVPGDLVSDAERDLVLPDRSGVGERPPSALNFESRMGWKR